MPYLMSNGKWRAKKTIEGQIKTKVFSTKTEAKRWEVEQTIEKWYAHEDVTDTVCLFDIASAYLDYSQGRYVKKTYNAKRLAFRRLFSMVDPALEPDGMDARKALMVLSDTAAKVTAAAANKDRKHYCAFWEWAKKYHGFPEVNPFSLVRRFPETPGRHYVPPLCDFWKAYDAAAFEDQVYLLFLLHTGARKSEAFALQWDDVNFKDKRVRLYTRKTSDGNRREDWLTMTNDLSRALAELKIRSGRGVYVFTDPATGRQFSERQHFMERLCKRAGVKPFGFHGIRGLTATTLASAGIPIPEIQAILRHTNPNTTARYIRQLGLSPDRLEEVFGRKEETQRTDTLWVTKTKGT